MKRLATALFLSIAALFFGTSCFETVNAEKSAPPTVEKKEEKTASGEKTTETKEEKSTDESTDSEERDGGDKLETATFGAGCYWCVEAVLERTDGVKTVVSGFMGGDVKNPKYDDVVRGTTGHAEVVQLKFDPEEISYEKLVALFWKLHDPTTLNQQGADRGTQYRSAIFYHSDEQKKVALSSKKKYAKDFEDPIVTEITKASEFYKAKASHQNFLTNNPYYGYNRAVVWPKLKKLGLENKEPVEK